MPAPERFLVWAIVAAATLGALVRPLRTSEAAWAAAGAVLLVAPGLVPLSEAVRAVGQGGDVCLFLVGMMLLAETARRQGLFDALAALAVRLAKGSPRRLFALVYAAGVAVTVFLSNDATAVVLTPAVLAAARRARAEPLPHLFACAMIANAASFVLPISNPANLVLYDGRMPPLGAWLASFALPSAAAVAATFLALRWSERRSLGGGCETEATAAALTRGGWTALAGLFVAVGVMLAASALGRPLGLPTAIMGAATAAAVCAFGRVSPTPILRGVSWSIVVLVGGLFVMVEALARTGVVDALAAALAHAVHTRPDLAPWAAGGAVALAGNLTNNLPAGLMASAAAAGAHAAPRTLDALLIGVDLGPNLSVTGSLATILWLAAIRREGQRVGFRRFLAAGALVMPPALIAALAARLL